MLVILVANGFFAVARHLRPSQVSAVWFAVGVAGSGTFGLWAGHLVREILVH